MPKVKAPTDAELAGVSSRADDLIQEIVGLSKSMDYAYGTTIADPISLARTFAVLGRDASHLAVLLIAQQKMQEQKAQLGELEKQLAMRG